MSRHRGGLAALARELLHPVLRLDLAPTPGLARLGEMWPGLGASLARSGLARLGQSLQGLPRQALPWPGLARLDDLARPGQAWRGQAMPGQAREALEAE